MNIIYENNGMKISMSYSFKIIEPLLACYNIIQSVQYIILVFAADLFPCKQTWFYHMYHSMSTLSTLFKTSGVFFLYVYTWSLEYQVKDTCKNQNCYMCKREVNRLLILYAYSFFIKYYFSMGFLTYKQTTYIYKYRQIYIHFVCQFVKLQVLFLWFLFSFLHSIITLDQLL